MRTDDIISQILLSALGRGGEECADGLASENAADGTVASTADLLDLKQRYDEMAKLNAKKVLTTAGFS
jgi:hypothetical protein